MTFRRSLLALALLALVARPAASAETPASSRVIVSTTLNSTVQFFDAATLEQTQPPLPSRGLGPVRLWVQPFGGRTILFAANHGAASGSVGAFDLDGGLVTEMPVSPMPARAGSVGVTAAVTPTAGRLLVGVTNATFALGPCTVMPAGSMTLYDATGVISNQPMIEIATRELSGGVPYAVSMGSTPAWSGTRVFASSSCSDTLDTFDVTFDGCELCPLVGRYSVGPRATYPTGARPDGMSFEDGVNYTVNIGGHSVSVHDASGLRATIPLSGRGPIDTAVGRTLAGRALLFTANGSDDSISVVDRSIVRACLDAATTTCAAEVARIPTAVRGGAPEGVAFDPATNRVFVVNKTFPPSLSVIQLHEHPNGSIDGTDIARIPLNTTGTSAPVPAPIAFDVVVQTR